MKKLIAIVFLAMASLVHAEASFDQIQTLIEQKNYAAAEKGLEVIIQNHPKSAKAFYAMAQAQAGLGNLEKARKALDIATGLNPTLDFAPQSSVRNLKEAITPQIGLIEPVEESHFWRNFLLATLLAGLIIFFAIKYKEKMDREEEARLAAERAERDRRAAEQKREWQEMIAKQEAERAAEEAEAAKPQKKKTKAQLKAEADAQALRDAQARADAAEADARRARMYYSSTPSSTPSTTVVNNSSGTDLLTGVMIGSMMNNHHHDTERTVIRETVREVPAPSRDSSWDDTPRETSRSSSWDDDSSSSSKKSSSWDSDSSSGSSSSWSSSSDSSSSSSSSSWD